MRKPPDGARVLSSACAAQRAFQQWSSPLGRVTCFACYNNMLIVTGRVDGRLMLSLIPQALLQAGSGSCEEPVQLSLHAPQVTRAGTWRM